MNPLSSYSAIFISLFIFAVLIVIANFCAEGQGQAKFKFFSGLFEPAPPTLHAWRLSNFFVCMLL